MTHEALPHWIAITMDWKRRALECLSPLMLLLSFDFGKTATCLYEFTKVESDMLRSMDMLIDWEIYGSNIR